MKFNKEEFKNNFQTMFKSQDSKFFISTAFKLTIIPIVSFCIVFYSLWTIMEMNFNFFVANGYNSGDVFKEAFYDSIFMGVSDQLPLFFGVIICVFLTGLFTSWLVLRSFETIEDFSYQCLEDPDHDLDITGLNKNKLINQVSRIFFKYLQICQRDGQRPRFKLPRKLENLKHPPFDKVFLLQYILIVSALCLATNIILFTFTNELYQELVNKGLELLEANRVVTNFLKSQESILFNIYSIAIGVNVVLYALISKNIIRSVDGVSFGFARDMLNVIRGEHETRLRPRYADPGKGVSAAINLYLDEVFPFIEEEDNTPLHEVSENTYQQLNHYIDEHHGEDEEETHISEFPKKAPQFQSTEDFHIDESDDIEDEQDNEYLEQDSNLVDIHAASPSDGLIEQMSEPDLPPAFVEEKMVSNGEKVFHITTPEGLKVENVDEDMLLKIVREIKK